jgi:hypothetical protein
MIVKMRRILLSACLLTCTGKTTSNEHVANIPDVSTVIAPSPAPTAAPSAEPDDILGDTDDDCSDVLTEPAVPRGASVMIVGDSLAVGMTPEFTSIAKRLGYKPHSHAIVGTTTSQWLRWIKKDLDSYKPVLVVVSLGTNDAADFENVKKSPGMYADLAKTIDDAGAFVVWLDPPAISPKKLEKIDETRKMINDSVPIYFESHRLDLKLTDGIHATSAGYRTWITQAWRWMAQRKIVADLE